MAADPDQALNAPTVLLAGASSQIGVFAIPRLLAAGFAVLAVSRSGRPCSLQEDSRVSWLVENEATQAAMNCEYLLSAGPMDLAQRLLDVCERLQSVVAFSSTSAETKADSSNRREKAQARRLLELESSLQSRARDKNVRLVIFRPTLVYGCGLDNNISLLAKWINRLGFIPVSRKATGLRQPVHADDLASLAVETLLNNNDLPALLNVAGGETLDYSEMVERIFTALGKPARLLRLPPWMFAALVDLASVFKAGGGINREMVKRQGIDLVFDDHQARELLAYNPRPFRPDRTDFSLPDF